MIGLRVEGFTLLSLELSHELGIGYHTVSLQSVVT